MKIQTISKKLWIGSFAIAAIFMFALCRHWVQHVNPTQNGFQQYKAEQMPSLRQFLQQANQVGVYQCFQAKDGLLAMGPKIAQMDNGDNGSHRENARMLSVLKRSAQFHHNPHSSETPAFILDFGFESRASGTDDDPIEVYNQQDYYFSSTGELGDKEDWCYVPSALKEWMKSLNKVKKERR